jgi:hypothetical protein
MDDIYIQHEINKYKKFKKVDGATYRKVNQFLRKRTYITAREWALARLCTDFRTSGGAEMTFIGKHLPDLVPFMEDTYSPQAVNQARNSFKKKVRKASATFFYGAMCGFFTTDELDDLLFEASEVARFLLEVEGTTLDIDDEIDIEDRITKVMRGVGEAAKTILKNRSEEIESDNRSKNNRCEPCPSNKEEQGPHNITADAPQIEIEWSNNAVLAEHQEILPIKEIFEKSNDAVMKCSNSSMNHNPTDALTNQTSSYANSCEKQTVIDQKNTDQDGSSTELPTHISTTGEGEKLS